jgi:hypothetical protein
VDVGVGEVSGREVLSQGPEVVRDMGAVVLSQRGRVVLDGGGTVLAAVEWLNSPSLDAVVLRDILMLVEFAHSGVRVNEHELVAADELRYRPFVFSLFAVRGLPLSDVVIVMRVVLLTYTAEFLLGVAKDEFMKRANAVL